MINISDDSAAEVLALLILVFINNVVLIRSISSASIISSQFLLPIPCYLQH